ncbi:MAG TPA: hypothetical protein VN611_17925 [Patescibacteria group bacterium]|nr:hypothetical protein [Patescibacteria group bacterium]
MERYMLVRQQLLELTDTMADAVRYLEARLLAGNEVEQIKGMLVNITEALYEVEKAMQPLRASLPGNRVYEFQEQLKRDLQEILTLWQQQEEELLHTKISGQFVPHFWLWQEEVGQCMTTEEVQHG